MIYLSKGHSPSSAHLEYVTNLMYQHDPQLLADRNINPKISDVYNLFNKWRKNNLGVRTGKELFAELEERINNKTLGRALDPHANGAWLSKLTE